MQKHVEQSADNPKLYVVTYHSDRSQANVVYAKLKESAPTLSKIYMHGLDE